MRKLLVAKSAMWAFLCLLGAALVMGLALALMPAPALADDLAPGNTEMAMQDDNLVLVVNAEELHNALDGASTDPDHPTTIAVGADFGPDSSDPFLVKKGTYVKLMMEDRKIWDADVKADPVFRVQGSMTIEGTGTIGRPLVGTAIEVDGGKLVCDGTASALVLGMHIYGEDCGVLVKSGTFELNVGEVKSGSGDDSVGVQVDSGTFNLKTGNVTTELDYRNGIKVNGGALYMLDGTVNNLEVDGGSATMKGGEITGSACMRDKGSFIMEGGTVSDGIYNYAFAAERLTVFGSAVVTGITGIEGSCTLIGSPTIKSEHSSEPDIRLPEYGEIVVQGALTKTYSVTTYTKPSVGKPVVFTSGLKGNGDASNFTSVEGAYKVTLNENGEAQLEVDTSVQAATLTYDLAGGTLDGKTDKVTVEAKVGDVVEILKAPTRDGYTFKYWKGSEYKPGDKYTVEGDHTFTAVWEKSTKGSSAKTGDVLGGLVLALLACAAVALCSLALARRRNRIRSDK